MRLIAVIARRAFSHGGRPLRPGDRFEASPIDAVVLVTARKAAFARVVPVKTVAAVVPARTIRRRELVTHEAPTVPTKRTYKRRDLTAEL
jgi:hypothetical protein